MYRAGQFYPAKPEECARELAGLVAAARAFPPTPGAVMAGIVPHAGWIYSGPTAARVFVDLDAGGPPSTVVVFGAVHVHGVPRAALWAQGAWATPLGDVAIDESLARRVLAAGAGLIEERPRIHEREHSIEVQVPFIRHLWPSARLLPVMVPPDASASRVGEIVARAASSAAGRVVALGSTDLTHYGPGYGVVTHGVGAAALAWARDENDAAMLARVAALDADAIVAEARLHGNACGPGAVAAALAFARARGAGCATLLDHTTSYDVRPSGTPTDFVGYAGVVCSA